MEVDSHVDIAILGGGAAGLSAAREARRRGATAAIVNAGPLGGDCTFTGCVPSKTVIEAARAGLGFDEAFARARSVVETIASTESAERLRAEGVTVVEAEGELDTTTRGRPAIVTSDARISARGVVLALGSHPSVPPIPGLEDIEPLTTETLWTLDEAPASLVVIGGGAVGCELAQALAGLGVAVTVLEMAPRLLTKEEPAASAIAQRALEAAGVTVVTGGEVAKLEATATGSTVHLSDGRSYDAERVLLAVGRRPNTDRGGLVEAGVDLDPRRYVSNDDDLSTSVRGVYVAGDLAGRLQFTHAADHMGRIAVTNILSRFGPLKTARFREAHVPWVTFTTPEIARIGFTEAEAAVKVPAAMVAELPMAEHDRAIAAGATEGFIKLIAGPRPIVGSLGGGRIIGATIVGERAGELMGEISLAVRLGAFTGRLAQAVHPYPTWSYGLTKVAAQFFTEVEGRKARPVGEETVRALG